MESTALGDMAVNEPVPTPKKTPNEIFKEQKTEAFAKMERRIKDLQPILKGTATSYFAKGWESCEVILKDLIADMKESGPTA